MTELRLLTGDLAAQRAFYVSVLGLPIADAGPDSFAVQAGATRLVFEAAPREVAMYHIAFNIPRNMLPQAKEWLSRQGRLLQEDGRDEFGFPAWNARAVYFLDAAGNLLEFIARQTLANDAGGPFGAEAILCVSEIGLPVDDVAAGVEALTARLGIAAYKSQSAEFAPLGDEHGLILVVAVGRPWGLAREAARVVPVNLTVRVGGGQEIRFPRLPYELG